MPNRATQLLELHKEKILKTWSDRIKKELPIAFPQEEEKTKDSILPFLLHLGNALSLANDKASARKISQNESILIVKVYTLDQLVWKYHILREVIFDVLQENQSLNSTESETILSMIEQFLNNATTEYCQFRDKVKLTVLHDLRNSITTVKTYAELLLRRPDDKALIHNGASQIYKIMDRLNLRILNLVEETLSKMDAGIPPQLSKCDLNFVCNQVVNEFNDISGNPFLFYSTENVIDNWNEDAIRRILENLSTNAIRYGKAHAPITIELSQTPEMAILKVHNEGNTFSKEMQKKLFQKKLHTTSKDWKGLGLLSIKELVESFQGAISVESSEEKGTTVTVTLPKKITRKAA